MKVLPQKKDIDKAKALERKLEIDSGTVLAKRVDEIRDLRIKEEKSLTDYRENALKSINYEIGQLIETRDNLDKQCTEARKLRKELIKPLDEEWLTVGLAKEQIAKEKAIIHKAKENLSLQSEKIRFNLEKTSKLVSKIKSKEEETEKNLKQSIALKDMTQKEYEIAKYEHDGQTESHETALLEANELKKQYEVGIQTNEREEGILKERKEELDIKEKKLQDFAETLGRSMEEIKRRENNLNT